MTDYTKAMDGFRQAAIRYPGVMAKLAAGAPRSNTLHPK